MRTNVRSFLGKKVLPKITFLGRYFPKVKKRNVLFFLCLAIILAIAISIRILPLDWGFHLSEFDPYYQYYVTRHISENGLFSWYGWQVDQMWFPQGRDIALRSFPAFPMTGAILYFISSFLGFSASVLDVCILFPVVFAAITCIVIFFWEKNWVELESDFSQPFCLR